ncbi:SPFH domain-containing protein, partial [Vibrio parahaemolyticus]
MEGKFVDALRSAAAEMTMETLHEQRAAFARKVRDLLRDELAQNGLAIES